MIPDAKRQDTGISQNLGIVSEFELFLIAFWMIELTKSDCSPLRRYLIEPTLLKNPLNRAVQLPPVRNFSGSYEKEFILGADLSGVDGTCSCLPRTRSFR